MGVQEGCNFLQKCFPEYPVHSVVVSGASLHLKSVMSMVATTMLFADTPAGKSLWQNFYQPLHPIFTTS